MQFDYPHSLGIDNATERLRLLCTYLLNRHGIKVQWTDNVARFDGKYMMIAIQGEMVVSDANIRFVGKDPGMLWRKKAINYLKEKLEIYMDPRTPVSELPTDKR